MGFSPNLPRSSGSTAAPAVVPLELNALAGGSTKRVPGGTVGVSSGVFGRTGTSSGTSGGSTVIWAWR